MKKLNFLLITIFFLTLIKETSSTIKNISSKKEDAKNPKKAISKRKLEGDDEKNSGEEPEESSEEDDFQKGEKLNFCQNELLYSFGILNSGYRNEKSMLCANAEKESCCSKTSEKLILNFWKNNNKLRIKEYLEGYVYLFKRIFNYYNNFLDKAKEIYSFPSAPSECRETAQDLISYFQDSATISSYFLKLEKTFQHLGFVRKSFYCVLCTTDTQGYFDVQKKTITFANKFCENLVESTINEFYERNSLFMRILNNLSILSDCETNSPYLPDSYKISMALDEEDEVALTKCYQSFTKDQDPRVYIPECLDYCGKFSITEAKEIIEGSFGKMFYLYNKIKSKIPDTKEPIFGEVEDEEEYDFSHVSNEFFESNLRGFDLGNYISIFDRNGIELFYISANTELVFGESGSNLFAIFYCYLFLIVLVFG